MSCFASASLAAPGDPPELLLPRLARVAGLFRESTLRFACEETISWSGRGVDNGRQTFGYVYVYDDAEGLKDYRTWVQGGNRISREVIPDEFGIPSYLSNAYLWMFVFLESRHDLHRYEIDGEGTVLGRPAVRIRFEPVPPYRPKINDWFGWTWIDAESSQPLRVEAYLPEDWTARRSLEAVLEGAAGPEEGSGPGPKLYEIQKITTEFSVLKNGMRFPGSIELRRSRIRAFPKRKYGRTREVTLVRVRQVYRNYEFFNVRAEDEIRGLVEGR